MPQRRAFVHWGTTSQDLSDTALVLCLAAAARILEADHARLARALRRLSETHKATVMLARTLLQPAPPITFGLKAAGWLAAASRGQARLKAAFREACVVQFGGASGTLAALGAAGPDVAKALAAELELPLPDAPWHAHRDRLAHLVGACGVYAGTLGKIARDISLLMQHEVGEASEPGGGSSSMPHKRNPAGCAIVLAAANRLPGLVSAFLSGMVQEHERGLGGWHAESSTIVGGGSGDRLSDRRTGGRGRGIDGRPGAHEGEYRRYAWGGVFRARAGTARAGARARACGADHLRRHSRTPLSAT